MYWDFFEVAEALGSALARAESELRLEQAVYGLDTRPEVELHGILARHLGERFGVHREVHYPSSAGRKLSHRQRCDLVLTPRGTTLLSDVEAGRPATLFDAPRDPASLCPPDRALWLEVKVAYQFREGGARHGGYGAQWRKAVIDDLRKMEADPLIREAGLVLVVFNESADILEKDLAIFEDLLMIGEVLAGFRQVRSTPILDRIGHRLATVAVWPTIQRQGHTSSPA